MSLLLDMMIWPPPAIESQWSGNLTPSFLPWAAFNRKTNNQVCLSTQMQMIPLLWRRNCYSHILRFFPLVSFVMNEFFAITCLKEYDKKKLFKDFHIEVFVLWKSFSYRYFCEHLCLIVVYPRKKISTFQIPSSNKKAAKPFAERGFVADIYSAPLSYSYSIRTHTHTYRSWEEEITNFFCVWMCKPCAEESLSCIELGEMVPLKTRGLNCR